MDLLSHDLPGCGHCFVSELLADVTNFSAAVVCGDQLGKKTAVAPELCNASCIAGLDGLDTGQDVPKFVVKRGGISLGVAIFVLPPLVLHSLTASFKRITSLQALGAIVS